MAAARRNYTRIVAMIYALLPYTLLKQKLFFRWRNPPAGLPAFMCIGAQKAGTTWLYEQLKQHPGVCMAEPKEVHYFDWFFYRSLNWYRKHFSCTGAKMPGEVTPGYSVIEKGRIRFIRRIMPRLKIILLLRDPRERAWSSARFHFGKELGRDLAKVTPEEFKDHFNRSWVQQRGEYETIWNKWTSVFPKEQVLVLLAENVGRDPQAVMDRVTSFLNLNNMHAVNAKQRYNESNAMAMPEEIRKYLNDLYAPMIARLPGIIGADLSAWKNHDR